MLIVSLNSAMSANYLRLDDEQLDASRRAIGEHKRVIRTLYQPKLYYVDDDRFWAAGDEELVAMLKPYNDRLDELNRVQLERMLTPRNAKPMPNVRQIRSQEND